MSETGGGKPVDRKALLREFKERVRQAGVFRVRNTSDDRSLVASSIDVPAAINRQRTQLKFGGHPNKALQAAWNALGADAFEFEVLDTLAPPEDDPAYDPAEDLRVLEALWLERLEPYGERGYNVRK